MTQIAIIGDFNSESRTHQATNDAIAHSQHLLKKNVSHEWVATERIDRDFGDIVQKFKALWIAPGSPYQNMAGVLRIIEFARRNNIPVLGTCGGFQHMVLEFARNVLRITDAEHAESNPYASKLVINPLSCVLKGKKLEIAIVDTFSKAFAIFGADTIFEKYYCNFGLNPQYQDEIDRQGFHVVGIDTSQEARILELKNHPFFIATLFVPQDSSTNDNPNKLITAFLRSI